MLVELAKEERLLINHLCMGIDNEIVLRSCLEGNMGRILVDKIENPGGAIVEAADFCYLLGSLSEFEHNHLITKLSERCRDKIIITDNPDWITFIEREFPNRFRKFSRYALEQGSRTFNTKLLNDYRLMVEAQYEITRIDESIYHLALSDELMSDCVSNYHSYEDFEKNGLGYVIIHEGQIICGASTYTYCEGNITVTIGTHPKFRRKGLALGCSSKLILASLEKNMYPDWNAANLHSVQLAEKLGYVFSKEYEVCSF